MAFLAVSLVLDRQPPLRVTHPRDPVPVLIAARNEAERIEETIACIARQDYPGVVEVLVVDNGSTDGTRSVVEAVGAAHGMDIRCVSESTPGKSHALNTGLAAVRTVRRIAGGAPCAVVDSSSGPWSSRSCSRESGSRAGAAD